MHFSASSVSIFSKSRVKEFLVCCARLAKVFATLPTGKGTWSMSDVAAAAWLIVEVTSKIATCRAICRAHVAVLPAGTSVLLVLDSVSGTVASSVTVGLGLLRLEIEQLSELFLLSACWSAV